MSDDSKAIGRVRKPDKTRDKIELISIPCWSSMLVPSPVSKRLTI